MGKAVMAFCYGDQWTNMLQPFWALPLLGITGLKAKQLIGYTAALMLLTAPVFILSLLAF
jgi:short-chain fatty acids transporter